MMPISGDHPKRALVLAAFFSTEMQANRSVSVACVLAELASVDVVTTNFDHWTKKPPKAAQIAPFERIFYLKTLPYRSNISVMRLMSHLLFSVRAAAFFLRHRHRYDIVYVTLPLNLLAWFILRSAPAQCKIVDVIDIWPDVLPFPKQFVQLFRPLFATWRKLFNRAVHNADVMLAVSDTFYVEALKFANTDCRHRRFYIGDVKLQCVAPKEDVLTIAYVGNIGHLYDFETLLDAMEDGKRAQLFIVGAGDRQDWLLNELERRGLPHQYFGVVYDPARLANILCRAHVGFNGYLNTSAAFSYKANTYFAAGLPILNSMRGDLHDLVELHGLGLNYSGGDRASLELCLASLDETTLLSMSQNCSRFFDAELERGAIRREMRAFLQECIKGGRA
jgi:glycosyltransferase involved in cell wall biosynthesis